MTITIDSVHSTMLVVWYRNNYDLLWNRPQLKPLMNNATRWSGKNHILRRFIQIREELTDLNISKDGDIDILISRRILVTETKFRNMIAKIEVVTKLLQTRCNSLEVRRDNLDFVNDTV